jgi:pimeloyl-ACP methyl ester carboxylesterase
VVVQNNQVELELNKRWLVTAGVGAPLFLKQVTLYDGAYHIPLASAAVLPVSQGASLHGVVAHLNLASTLPAPTPTLEMRHGVRPAHLDPKVAAAKRAAAKAQGNATVPSLVLLHGYCAQDNPWIRTPSIPFTDYVAFDGLLGQSKLNDDYAKDVIDSYNNLPSYGLIGHSQGGMVSVHIRNFYWTGNDAVAGSNSQRPIQSMGTPYLGVSGAGAALDLGALFGLGCGNNFDLTLDGANLWKAALEEENVQNTYYYTTVYKYTFLHPRYCSLATNLVLKWPNDGTAEYDQCLLEGANHVSNTEGECHSVNMKWPPQTDNVQRNAEMNQAAMR